MSLEQVSLLSMLVAFVAGVLSFVSPCVLPLIPGYISFISGATLEQMRGRPAGVAGEARAGVATAPAAGANRRILLTSLAFVAGFSLVFVAFGATASVIGQLLGSHKSKIAYVAGALLIVLGLHMMGVFRIGFLDYEKRAQTSKRPAGPARRGAGGHRVRVRLDALHRPDPRRHPDDRRRAGERGAGRACCWPPTRSASASRSC